MPELPEVEVVKQSLQKYILNKNLLKIKVNIKKLRFPIPVNLSKKLSDLKIICINRKSKHVIIKFENYLFLIIHLGMSGTLHLIKNKKNLQNTNLSFYHSKKLPKKHNHIFFYFKNFTIIFNDPRRFGYLKLIQGQTNLDNYFRKYGPEPLEKEFNFRYLKNYLQKKTKSIKNTLMDQYSISGIGNIYASEILNYSKVNPLKESYKINNQEINKIVFYTKKVLKHAIRKGGTSINNFQSIRGDLGSYQKEFRAYGREKEKCKNKLCSGTIEKLNISNRSTYLCNNCQKS